MLLPNAREDNLISFQVLRKPFSCLMLLAVTTKRVQMVRLDQVYARVRPHRVS